MRAVGALLLAATAGIAIANLFQNNFFSSHALGADFWLLLGLTARAAVSAGAEESPAGAPLLEPFDWRYPPAPG